MKNLFALLISFSFLLHLAACQTVAISSHLKNVGMLLPDTIDDQVWNSKGYRGLLAIASTYNVDAFYKEGINTEAETRTALDEFLQEDVNLVFGHGNIYADIFSRLKKDYPDLHFVTFNSDATGEDFTSFHFNGEAMGYFGGKVAAEMTETQHIGMIAAFPWQPEVDGFKAGAKTQDATVRVHIGYTGDWEDEQEALSIFADFIANDVDVFYPAGNGFNLPVIENVKREGLYAIGYVSDQANLGKATILTSTVQDVESIYMMAADQHRHGKLKTGNIDVDFDSGALLLGKFSPVVPETLQKEINEAVERYIETGKLPKTP